MKDTTFVFIAVIIAIFALIAYFGVYIYDPGIVEAPLFSRHIEARIRKLETRLERIEKAHKQEEQRDYVD